MSVLSSVFNKINDVPFFGSGFYGVILPRTDCYLGKNKESHIALIIPMNELDNTTLTPISLKYFKFTTNVSLRIELENNEFVEGEYFIIQFCSDQIELQNYFIGVCETFLLEALESNSSDLLIELKALITIFERTALVSKLTIQGLFAELIFILASEKIDNAINAWHTNVNNKFDFVYKGKIFEVKSTTRSQRKHKFGFNQINRLKDQNGYLVSIVLSESDSGNSVIELAETIKEKVTNKQLAAKLHELVLKTIGSDLDRVNEVRYDLKSASESIEIYSSQFQIIERTNIPNHISEIGFLIDFDLLPPMNINVVDILN